ncbi:MAG: hypothetical protein Q8L48_41780 [Archangium sp.]|nr:hypothetical protein [Archangium sp.]
MKLDGAMQGLTRSDARAMWADAPVLVFLLTTPRELPWQEVEPVFVLLDVFAGIR